MMLFLILLNCQYLNDLCYTAGKASGLKIIKNDCIKRTSKGLATLDNK
ncbi:hypothetical protein N7281_04645 [Rickettsia hoogstraalii]|nr:hypothetical protein [Rickettsia hoogstraalii]MCX4084136.1 hypothetical protein [Rickettsia hoogstraalii]